MNEDIESRHAYMLTQLRERIEADYEKVKTQGVSQPAVVVLHLACPLAQTICQVARPIEAIHAHIAEANLRGVDPIVTWAMSATAVASLLQAEHAAISGEILAGPWKGKILVVCVSAAGVSLASLPVP